MASADKTLSALGAFVGLVIRMHFHMLSECDCCSEALTTFRASVWLFRGVHHLVGFQVECINDTFTNQIHTSGDVALLFHMDLHMPSQTSFYSKALTTVDTDVGVGSFMDFKVLVQISHAAEYLPALIALQAMGLMNDNTIL